MTTSYNTQDTRALENVDSELETVAELKLANERLRAERAQWQKFSQTVLVHLVDISTGVCRIDDAAVLSLENENEREVLQGLRYVHEDLQLAREEILESEHRASAERERVLISSNEALVAHTAELERRRKKIEAALQQLDKTKAKYQRLFDNALDMIHVVDSQFRISDVNNTELAALGYAREELLGKKLYEIIHPDLREGTAAAMQLVQEGIPMVAFETTLVSRSGEAILVVANVVPHMVHGKFSGAQATSHDMTARKKTEQRADATARLNEQKVEELKALNAELRETQSQLVQSAKLAALGELGAGIAHELNQPLTVISGITELALDTTSEMPANFSENMSTILSESQRMASIINNIKTFARETVEDHSAICLGEVVKRALGLVGEQLRQNGIQVEELGLDRTWMIFGNFVVLQQVVLNLLINAQDALLGEGAGSQKQICLSLASEPDGKVTLKIEDSGPGVPESAREKIFQPFFTTKKAGTAHGSGTGLGLSITHGIVTKHGGTIEQTDSRFGGAGFAIVFPEHLGPAKPAVQAEQVEHAPADANAPIELSVLLVDDDPLVRAVVQAIIARLGCDVHAVGSGAEALDYLQGNTTQLLVTDFMMPEMNGAELISATRKAGVDVPVVVITGGRTERIVKLAEDAGAMACVEKPINRRKFRGILERVAAMNLQLSGH